MLFAAIGALVLDVTIAPEGQLRLDDNQRAGILLAGGGQAANFAAWTAWLGVDSRLMTRVGADEAGQRLVAELEAGGVDVRAVRGSDPTGAIAVLVAPDGSRTFATQQGASLGLRPEEIRPEWLAGLSLLHVPAYSLFTEPLASATRAAVTLARQQGALLSVDLSSSAGIRDYGASRLTYDLTILGPDILFASEEESTALGSPLSGLARVPVVKHGSRGCSVYGRTVPAPVVTPADGNGAGDAFAAGFCVALLSGEPPLEAAGLAVWVGAEAVRRRGARPPYHPPAKSFIAVAPV